MTTRTADAAMAKRAVDRTPIVAGALVVVIALVTGAGSIGVAPVLASIRRRHTTQPVPTQFIAKQYTEGLGRAPTAIEWRRWIDFFGRPQHACGVRSMGTLAKEVFLGREFSRLRYRRAEALSALSRATLNRNLDGSMYQRDRSAHTRWREIVQTLVRSSAFSQDAATICSSSRPGYYFDNSVRPLQTATGPGFRGTAQALQTAMDRQAQAGGGTVWLARAALIYVGEGAGATPQRLDVPAGVRLATVGLPSPRSYEKMARLVAMGHTCLFGTSCDQAVVTVDGGGNPSAPGGQVRSVWIDGNGGNPAFDPADGAAVAQLESGTNSGIFDSRLDGASPGAGSGTDVLGLQGAGNYLGRPCSNLRASGNLITAYSTDHFVWRRWADGIGVDCADARIDHNTIVDASDAGISLFGDPGTDQRSSVFQNYVLSAGNDAFAALNADPHGVCGPDCTDSSPRNFGGSSFEDNTFISGPRTGFGFGISLGSRPLFGGPPDGIGASATNNNTGGDIARVNVGVSVNGMFGATLTGNTGRYTLVHINGCPLLHLSAGVSAGAASFATPPQPYTDIALISCWPTPVRTIGR